jgi:hypothetical protein
MVQRLIQFNIRAFPEGEREIGVSAQSNINSMQKFIGNFARDLSLFNFVFNSTPAERLNSHFSFGWLNIAARDGAMNIYHFMCAMEGAKACIHRCPTLVAGVNRCKARSATKHFSKLFPQCENLRNAVAHIAELTLTPEKRKVNSFSGEVNHLLIHGQVNDVMISDSLVGNEYTCTIRGELISYNISKYTLDNLVAIADEFHESFISSDFIWVTKLG